MTRTIRTFFDSASEIPDDLILLNKIESHHLINVLRLEEGAEVEAIDGEGSIIKCAIRKANAKSVSLNILHKETLPLPRPIFRMCVALTKGCRWDELIKPLTELGAGHLTPLITDFSQVKIDHKKLHSKMEKWQKICEDACKQSGNPWLPVLDPPQAFSKFADRMSNRESFFMGSLSKNAKPLSSVDFQVSKNYTLLIGPEGGWSEQEEEIAKKNNFNFFSLGSNTLRVETAAISCLAVARGQLLP